MVRLSRLLAGGLSAVLLSLGCSESPQPSASPSSAPAPVMEALAPPPLAEREPNNTRTTANRVDNWILQITGTVGSSTDLDYFQLNLPAGVPFKAVMTGPSGKDYDLYLLAADGSRLASSLGPTASESLRYTPTKAVTVVLKVVGDLGAWSTQPYTLTLTRTAPTPTTAYLIRHAEKANNTPESDLLWPNGFNRANAWGFKFSSLGVKQLYCSNLLRSRRTAQKIGDWVLLVPVQFPAKDYSVPGDEPTLATSRELAAEIKRHPGETSVVVFHTGLLEELARNLGVPASKVPVWSETTFDHLWTVRWLPDGTATLEDTFVDFGDLSIPPR